MAGLWSVCGLSDQELTPQPACDTLFDQLCISNGSGHDWCRRRPPYGAGGIIDHLQVKGWGSSHSWWQRRQASSAPPRCPFPACPNYCSAVFLTRQAPDYAEPAPSPVALPTSIRTSRYSAAAGLLRPTAKFNIASRFTTSRTQCNNHRPCFSVDQQSDTSASNPFNDTPSLTSDQISPSPPSPRVRSTSWLRRFRTPRPH